MCDTIITNDLNKVVFIVVFFFFQVEREQKSNKGTFGVCATSAEHTPAHSAETMGRMSSFGASNMHPQRRTKQSQQRT